MPTPLTIFTSDDCPLCNELKGMLPAARLLGPRVLDAGTVDGMAEYQAVREATNDLPLLITFNGRLYAGQAALDFVRERIPEAEKFSRQDAKTRREDKNE